MAAKTQFPAEKIDFTEVKDGVFSTFMDFRSGNSEPFPKIRFGKSIMVHTDIFGRMFSVIKVLPENYSDKKKFDEVWGVQFRGKPYVKIGNYCYEIKRTTNGKITSALPV